MSLFSALTAAVSGLTAQSDAIGNISQNLANTNTIGYKRVDTAFETLVTQSNAFVNDPGGVRSTPQYQNDVNGSLVQSQNSTSLAISGAGFFAVRPATTDSTGNTTFSNATFYTRRGDFTLDRSGFMVNGAGFYLTGYKVNDNGAVDSSAAVPVQISALLDNPVATNAASYAANLPSSAAIGFSSSPSTVQIYDALGNTHDMNFSWTKTGTNAWTLHMDVADGKQSVGSGGATITSDYSANVPFVFNDTTNIGTVQSITSGGASYSVIDNSTAPENQAQISFGLSFAGAGSQSLKVSFGDYDTSSGLTQFADTTTSSSGAAASSVAVTSFEQNGIPRGSFTNLSIDQNGFLSLNYSNGSSKIVYQIPIVQFYAQDQLQSVSGGAFSQTLASGTPRYGTAGSIGAGTISSNSLESSNVDIAGEFTAMIQAQRVYSANAKTVTTADEMLQDVINIVR